MNLMKNFFVSEANWIKGVMVSTDGTAMCMVGAINAFYPETVEEVRMKIRHYLCVKYAIYSSIIAWNDHFATFKDIKKICEELSL